MRLSLIFGLVGALLCSAAPASARATRWHLDIDAAYLRGSVHFAHVPVPNIACLKVDCRIEGIDQMDVGHATFGLGYGTLTLEGSLSIPVREAVPYRAFSAGIRLQSSADAVIAVAFRFAYVRSTIRGLDGQGGRAAIAFVIRFHPAFQLYAEGSIEASTVPEALHETGTMLSYTPLVGLGVRMSLQ